MIPAGDKPLVKTLELYLRRGLRGQDRRLMFPNPKLPNRTPPPGPLPNKNAVCTMWEHWQYFKLGL